VTPSLALRNRFPEVGDAATCPENISLFYHKNLFKSLDIAKQIKSKTSTL
jgi:hypothetical protein